jgi:hypothetical protein
MCQALQGRCVSAMVGSIVSLAVLVQPLEALAGVTRRGGVTGFTGEAVRTERRPQPVSLPT